MSDLDITKKVCDKLGMYYHIRPSVFEDEIELEAYAEDGSFVGNTFFNLDGSFQENEE